MGSLSLNVKFIGAKIGANSFIYKYNLYVFLVMQI
ncbi:hypothetical protein CCYN49044_690004 [Capnocytophaga cynodegmi]|uniref:Uncharacterized protein n=1 Tax=Capnocytophaga cynodegmi TaxID=28189 RepID=A0A0B7HR41_9FLAO|nr:hypothetical protein CCYN74_340004 [Capnocytophaga cynodegmi]CEN42156.1 hypothetical protein CCYN49044_690004 [Capnocytophaga cynodegmi]